MEVVLQDALRKKNKMTHNENMSPSFRAFTTHHIFPCHHSQKKIQDRQRSPISYNSYVIYILLYSSSFFHKK